MSLSKAAERATVQREEAAGQTLLDLASSLAAAQDLPSLLCALQAYVDHETPAEGLFVSLYDHERGVRQRVHTCVSGRTDATAVTSPLSEGLHAVLLVEREPLVVPDVQQDHDVELSHELETLRAQGLDARATVLVPIVAGGTLLGALEAHSSRAHAFDADAVRRLALAAALAAPALARVLSDRELSQVQARLDEQQQQVGRLAADAERRIDSRTRQLEAANQELDAFAYTVAHDLRAPLRAVRMLSGLVLEDNADKLDAETVTSLRAMADSSIRMTQLVDSLFALSQSARGEVRREPVDLSEMAREVVEELKAADPQRPLHLTIQPGLVAHADRRMMRVVLANLLGNAWKFSSRKPEVRIEVGADTSGAFYVRDHGEGFDMARAHNLFQAFQRLHPPNQFEGTGIGLATVARIVRRHGGRVSAEGMPGQGATVRFTVPPA